MSEMLQIQNLSISFGGIHALSDVSFDVHKGEVLGLIGPNGSGKSTTVNIVSGIYTADSGKVIFDGKEVPSKLNDVARAKLGIGRTFQTPKPFSNMSVYDNVFAIALQKHSFKEAHERTREILDLTGLNKYAEMLSAKLPIEKRKWLDMARILVTDPKILMLDEVMAGLNHSEMDESVELVKRINKSGLTILFIEHIMKAVVNLCERVVVLNQGKLLAQGEPVEVLRRKEVVEAYLGGANI